jgi:hypothetical protein
MTGPRLFFESTRNFLQSAIRTVIPLLQKIPCESKALRDDVQGSTNAVEAGAENRHPAPWREMRARASAL